MEAATETADATAQALRPLTERILADLPGPAALWIAAWALVPWLNAAANLGLGGDRTSAVWEQSTTLVVLNYVALSGGVVIALWGSGRIARRLEALRAERSKVLAGDVDEPFRGMSSLSGPLGAAAVTALVLGASTLAREGWGPAVLRGTTWLIIGTALWTFLWTYASLQLGLGRLGRQRLLPEAVRVDPSLGLRPLGNAAFAGLWMLLVWLVPVLLTGLPDLPGIVLGLLVLAGGLGFFTLSIVRLHRNMVEVKAAELAFARELYAQAYEPVRAARSLEALERQQGLLAAADALEKRAGAIHEWPIADATFAWVITITTSVLAMTLGRLILSPLGL